MTRLPWKITTEMFLSEAEIRGLLRHVRGRAASASDVDRPLAELDRLIVEILLFSGLRTSECCKLLLGDTAVGREESVLVVRGPGREGRTVHVARWLSELIRGFAREWRPRFLSPGIRADDLAQPLLLNERRRPYERTGLYRRVKRILTEAGLGDRASVQLLRHTYGFLAYKRTGGNLLFVQRQLGHAHPMITSVYARLVEESYDEMAERVYGPPASLASVAT